MQWAEKGQEGRGTKDFKVHSGPASQLYRKNKDRQTESLLGGEGSLGDAECSACCPRRSCSLRITLLGLPHLLCLAYEALNQCLLKTTAVAEPSTHIRRRPWKGSGTSCYHRAASVEPCGEKGQRATHCSAALHQPWDFCCIYLETHAVF